jgi:release factor glutamine methyltransferase
VFALKSFFEINEKRLLKNYPGITFGRLQREFQDNPQHLFDQETKEKFLKGEPLAYIFKQSFFYNSFFYIDERVLIPRLETELLVAETIEVVKSDCSICEVGIGSGAIALSLLKECNKISNIVGVDISKEALDVAKINKFRQSYALNSDKLTLLLGDRLKDCLSSFDIIVSNPPYIKELADINEVHQKVDEFEPHEALYLPDESYDLWFTDFFKDAYNKLNENGYFLMEGHENHLERQKEECLNIGFKDVSIINDLTNRNRILKARK